ncbi:PAS domain S-box protein [Syntrophorhabdus aromaticivorans]|uniref:histidine kinase n=1 Tax=Syntrophorhabdus aromaticivorans TaxID=328301 RepID=A0A971M7J6_9BACT|nr:PAS domain S-box protein [Syntrophorhabdus aromaticivorans]NLW36611.1 PAS domain S-box protein [Syntrophorhabdus aromaticivorans]
MDLAGILTVHRNEVVKEWIRRLHGEVSPAYSAQSVEVLYETVSVIADANFAALINDDFSGLDDFVERIGKIRSRAGFSLSDVQKAFELYRTIILRILGKELEGPLLIDTIERLNFCLSYTIHSFSDYFQALSEQEIRKYAQALEAKVAERTKELAESEAKYRTLVEEIHDGYFVNQKGRIAFANKAFCIMHGYTLTEVIGRPYTDFVASESLDEVRRFYEKRVAEGRAKEHYVYFRLHKNGTALPTENRVALTFYEGDVAAIGICRDITERMQVEKRIREAESLARIGHLTTSLAHEIRNPLSAAKMSIQMLLKNPAFQGNEARRLEILEKEISRLDKIVTEMLDFAKPVKYDFRPTSMTELLGACLEALETKITEKGIAIKKIFPKRLPDVVVDQEKMEQAAINLLLNSIEAVDTGDGIIRVAVKHQKGPRNLLRVEIRDNGYGVGEEDLPYIFDPFYSKKVKGTGLGLANAKRIVEAHGGSIQALPVHPRGMSMSFTVPAA